MSAFGEFASRCRSGPGKLCYAEDPRKHTTSPIVTGTSVVACKYNGGVMMAADTLASYGSMARFKEVERVTKINDILVAADGDISDYGHIKTVLRQLEVDEKCIADGINYTPKQIYAIMSGMLYQRRTKMNPLWNNIVVAGMEGNVPFLGTSDKIGTKYECDYVATGIGLHMAGPILYDRWKKDMSEDEARALLEDCMRVLYYRDCRTINNITFARVKPGSVEIDPPVVLKTEWTYDLFVNNI